MKYNNNIKTLLGIKQKDIALLLQVTRSQWSMYEIGKRDLPVAAKLKLANMLAFVQKPTHGLKVNFEHLPVQELQRQNFFENQMVINQHRQLIATKKLKSIEEKYNASMNALKLIAFLKTEGNKSSKDENTLLSALELKATTAIQKNGLDVQAKHQLAVLALQQEETVLTKMFKKQS